jgi:hypothetical protein
MRVRRDFKQDAVLRDNSRLPSINIAPSLARSPSHTLDASVCATPSSSSQSEVEVSGSPITTPTGAILSLHNHTAKHGVHKNHKASIPTAASPSSSESSIETSGNPILTPTKAIMPHKRIAKHNPSINHHIKRGQYIPPLDSSPSPSWPDVSHPPSRMTSGSPPLLFPSVSPYGSSSMKWLCGQSSVSSR